MIHQDNKDAVRVIAELTAESGAYRRQFVIWVGVGSGAGTAAVLTFAEKFGDPVAVLHVLLPSMIGFNVGILGAAASVLFAGLRDSAAAGHHTFAHNRDELAAAIRQMPQVLASAKRVADEMNHDRNRLIERHDRHHALAESEWSRRLWWDRLYLANLALAAFGFLIGAAYPTLLIARDDPDLRRAVATDQPSKPATGEGAGHYGVKLNASHKE